MFNSGQIFDRFDHDVWGSSAMYLGSGFVEIIGDIYNLRITAGAGDVGLVLGENGAIDDVFGAGMGWAVKIDVTPSKRLASGDNVAGVFGHFRSHILESFNMEIDWPGAQGAASGERDAGFAGSGEDWAEHEK